MPIPDDIFKQICDQAKAGFRAQSTDTGKHPLRLVPETKEPEEEDI